MLYVILQKELATENVSVFGVYDSEELAMSEMDMLIDENEDFGYKMDVAKEGRGLNNG